jgi:hypothetical protein
VKSKGNYEPRQHLSARRFKDPSPLFRWCDSLGIFDKPGAALVFGAGLLAEADALVRRNWIVDALETRASVEARSDFYNTWAEGYRNVRIITDLTETKRKYRIITVTHVIEFIPDPALRCSILRDLRTRLTNDGRLLLSLRGWSDVNAAKNKHRSGDGIITGLGTWTRGYTMAEAKTLLESTGLCMDSTPHSSRAKSPEQVRFLCRKTNAS